MGPGRVWPPHSCPLLTLFSKLYLLRSRDSVALRSPWVRAPCQRDPGPFVIQAPAFPNLPQVRPPPLPHLLTRLSSRLATMEANLRSPASSEMRKTYSGAETWLDL